MAVSIVGHTVGGTSPVGSSILVPASGGVEHAVERMWSVEVDLAIANSVFGCTVLVRRMLGCESQGIVHGKLAVRRGIYRQKWLGVVCV